MAKPDVKKVTNPAVAKDAKTKPTTNAELRAEWKKETARADAAELREKNLRAQATGISQSYLDIRSTAKDMALIVAAQGRLFAKLPGIYEPPKK